MNMKITVQLYPPFIPETGPSKFDIEVPLRAKLDDILQLLSCQVAGFGKHLPQRKEDYILRGSMVPVMDGRVISYQDELEEGALLKIFPTLDGG